MAFTLPFTTLAPFEVFAVSATTAQIAWRKAGRGNLTASLGGVETPLGEADRPGVAEIGGLTPDTTHRIDLLDENGHAGQLTIHSGPSLTGGSVMKVATFSDLHLGETAFGITRTMRESHGPADDYPLRCTLAAVRESIAWGADLIVFKGDLTDSGKPAEWELFDRILDEIELPVLAVPGNHDVVGVTGSIDHRRALESRGLDSSHVQIHDNSAIRVVAVDSTIPGLNRGSFTNHIEQVNGAIDTDKPVLVFTHHHFVTTPVPYFWPPGIRGGESRSVLAEFARINPNMLVSSGHTHRNRSQLVGPILVTEVGSVKDHPGVWAGYEVHATGVRQTVRRLTDPGCVAWTDRTHAAVAGIWGRWSPGTIEQRSITHAWPAPSALRTDSEPTTSRRSDATDGLLR